MSVYRSQLELHPAGSCETRSKQVLWHTIGLHPTSWPTQPVDANHCAVMGASLLLIHIFKHANGYILLRISPNEYAHRAPKYLLRQATSSIFVSSCTATFPDELGTSVPLVEEEQKELLYVPLDGEWGCRTRADECERIIKAMDQLCTLGATPSNAVKWPANDARLPANQEEHEHGQWDACLKKQRSCTLIPTQSRDVIDYQAGRK